jgi:hypothetical protein
MREEGPCVFHLPKVIDGVLLGLPSYPQSVACVSVSCRFGAEVFFVFVSPTPRSIQSLQ